jgi:uncharacterized protein
MRVLAALILLPGLAAATLPSIPPPIAQSAADCVSPVYASDHLVCADASLRALDQELAARLSQMRARPAIAKDAAWEGDTDWFRRSRRCAFEAQHRRCLVEAYGERLALIKLAAAPPVITDRALDCSGAWAGRALSIEFDSKTGYAIIRGTSPTIWMGAAAPASRTPVWQPFAVFSRSANDILITALSASPIACSLRRQAHGRT